MDTSVNLPPIGARMEPSINLPPLGARLEPSTNLPPLGARMDTSVPPSSSSFASVLRDLAKNAGDMEKKRDLPPTNGGVGLLQATGGLGVPNGGLFQSSGGAGLNPSLQGGSGLPLSLQGGAGLPLGLQVGSGLPPSLQGLSPSVQGAPSSGAFNSSLQDIRKVKIVIN